MANEHDENPPGEGGLGDLFAQVEQAQERIQTAAAAASATIVEGSAGDGRVVVQLSGDLDAVSVHVDPSLVDPDDVGMLEDLLLAAIRDGLGQVAALQEEVAGAFSGGLGGFDIETLLGGLGGFPGLGSLPGLGNLAGLQEDGSTGGLPDLGAFGTLDMGVLAQLRGLGDAAGRAEVVADDDDEGTASGPGEGGPDGRRETAGAGAGEAPAGGSEAAGGKNAGADDEGADGPSRRG